MQLGLASELGGQLAAQRVEEVRLGNPPSLELEQGVLSLPLRDPLHRDAEALRRDPRLVLEGEERVKERRRQDAAEVGDHRADRHSQRGRNTS